MGRYWKLSPLSAKWSLSASVISSFYITFRLNMSATQLPLRDHISPNSFLQWFTCTVALGSHAMLTKIISLQLRSVPRRHTVHATARNCNVRNVGTNSVTNIIGIIICSKILYEILQGTVHGGRGVGRRRISWLRNLMSRILHIQEKMGVHTKSTEII